MQVTLQIPDIHFGLENPQQTGQKIKLYLALMMYQLGKASAGAACEIAETDRFTFLSFCKQHGINVIRYNIEDIRNELAGLK